MFWVFFVNFGFFFRFKVCFGDKLLRFMVGIEWSLNLFFEKRSLEESGFLKFYGGLVIFYLEIR